MAGTATGIQVYIGATIEGLQQGLGQATGLARSAGRRIAEGLRDETLPATTAVTRSFGSLGDSMRDYARSQRQEAGTARFFVQEITAIVPASDQVKTGLMGITSAIAGGGRFGAALALATTGIQLVTSSLKEEAEADAAAARATVEHAAKLQQLRNEALLYVKAKGGATQTDLEYEKFMQDHGPKELDAQRRRRAAVEDLAKAERGLARSREAARNPGVSVGAPVDPKVFERMVRERQAAVDKIDVEILALQGDRRQAELVRDTKNAGDRVEVEKKAKEELTQMSLRHMDELERIAEEEAIAEAELRKRYAGASEATIKAMMEEVHADTAAKLLAIDAQYFQDRAAMGLKAATSGSTRFVDSQGNALGSKENQAPQIPFAGAMDVSGPSDGQKRIEANLAAQDAANAYMRDRAREAGQEIGRAYVEPMVGAFSQGLAQMIQGQASFKDVMASMWSSIVSMVTQKMGEMLSEWITSKITESLVSTAAAETEITANAGVAASGAAASQAGIPFIGPALALAAMASMFAAVMKMRESIHSAADGMDIPWGVNPLTQLHEKEMVLPAEHAETIRGLRRGGARGGGDTFVIRAMDSRSFEDFLRRNDKVALRVIADAIRDRR
jgi:hypothetical protein